MVLFTSHKTKMPAPADALPGRSERPFEIPARHAVLGTPLEPPFPDGLESAVFALGCFWGAERLFWTIPGVYTTAVGYTGGYTPNPTYEEVCSGRTGHAEAVLVVFDPERVSYGDLLKVFFEEHDPTQGMRQGNDVGTQYRSAIFVTEDKMDVAERATAAYDGALRKAGHRPVTTEIAAAGPFFYAEDYHQQYLHKVPNGYCGLEGTGVACSIPAPANSPRARRSGAHGSHPSSTRSCAGRGPSKRSPASTWTPTMTASTGAPRAGTSCSIAERNITRAPGGRASPRRWLPMPSNSSRTAPTG